MTQELVPRSVPDAARWVDSGRGAAEFAAFLTSGEERILAFRHEPPVAEPTTLVLICGSLFEDLHVNYRTELLLARELARRGCAVARFHYRHTGNSDDLTDGHLSFDTMAQDARAALAWLQHTWPSTPVVLCGFRIGALLASSLAEELDASLVVWSPVFSGRDYFRRLSRASRLADVRTATREGSAAGGTEGELRKGRSTEMLAHHIDAGTYADLEWRCLPEDVGRRRVLIVDVGLGDASTADVARVTARWERAGTSVSVRRIPARQQWFVPDKWEPEDARPATKAVVTVIVEWMLG